MSDVYRQAYLVQAARVTRLSVLLGRIEAHVSMSRQPNFGRTAEEWLAMIGELIAQHDAAEREITGGAR